MALLDAEWASLRGKQLDAMHRYEAAITAAEQRGFIQDQALIHQRFGEFFLSNMNDPNQARIQFQMAIQLYEDWGAYGVAAHWKEKYHGLI